MTCLLKRYINRLLYTNYIDCLLIAYCCPRNNIFQLLAAEPPPYSGRLVHSYVMIDASTVYESPGACRG